MPHRGLRRTLPAVPNDVVAKAEAAWLCSCDRVAVWLRRFAESEKDLALSQMRDPGGCARLTFRNYHAGVVHR